MSKNEAKTCIQHLPVGFINYCASLNPKFDNNFLKKKVGSMMYLRQLSLQEAPIITPYITVGNR